jgi:hypothetical protein
LSILTIIVYYFIMITRKVQISIYLVIFLLMGLIIHADENPNDFSNDFKEAIKNGTISTLASLEIMDKAKYDLIINYIFYIYENEIIEHFYYTIGFNPEGENNKTEYIYAIIYYERFFNKYKNYIGDPTGKCFSVIFNENSEIIRTVHSR